MTDSTLDAQARTLSTSPLSTFMRYVNTRFSLPLHVFYSTTWTLMLLGVFSWVQGTRDTFSLGFADAIAVFSVLGLFFFMRTVDEVKDLEYDRIYKPDRALVQGLVTPRAMDAYLALCATLLFAVNIAISWKLALSAGAVMAYSLFLLWFERAVPGFERTLYLNTAVSVQLKTGTVFYVYLVHHLFHGGTLAWLDAPLILACVCAYLHWEVARKIQWPALAQPGEKLYSARPGVGVSLLVPFALLGTFLGVVLGRMRPWEQLSPAWLGALPALAIVPLAVGVVRLLQDRKVRSKLGVFAQVGYIWMLLCLVVFCHGASVATFLPLATTPLFLFELPGFRAKVAALFAFVELRVFRAGVYATAWLVQSPLHRISRVVMGKLGAMTAMQRKASLQPSAEALGPAWQSMFPVDKRKLPIVGIEGRTVRAEIHEFCPLQGTGDLGACDRMMEFDRALLARLGARLEIVRSQAEPGVKVCEVAFHMLEAEEATVHLDHVAGVPT